MTFTPSEFIQFASATRSHDWHTLSSQKRSYSYSIEPGGIRVVPSSGKGRLISTSMINRFLELYNDPSPKAKLELKDEFNNSYLLPIAKAFDPTLIDQALAEEIVATSELHEGAVRLIAVNAYERSYEARRLCIAAHGTNCSVCTFDFEAVYGDFAAGFIHVHHLFPLALRAGEYTVDPVADLRPVCPNCHAVIHLGGGCMSIEQAKALLRTHT